jgi:hypothetical protein
VKDSALLFTLGLAIRVVLIHLHPIVFGGDTILRLVNRDRILMSYQLPLLQALIYGISRFTHDVLAIRYLMAILGAGAGVAFYWLARQFVDRPAALGAALLFVSNPFLIELSIVPYQEVLMLGLVAAAFAFYFAEHRAAASIALGLACFTRFEAWAACPILIFRGTGLQPVRAQAKGLCHRILLYGWAPLVWIAAHIGLASAGSFVIEPPHSIARLMRIVYLGWITVKNVPPPALALVALGVFTAWKLRDRRLTALAAFFALFLASILCSAHGVSPDPERFVTSREATLCISAAIFLAGFALLRWPLQRWQKMRAALVALGFVWGVWDAHRFLVRDTSDPHVQLGYRLAGYLDANLKGNERVVILAPPVPPELVSMYLDKVAQLGGDLERARRNLADSETTPPDYQRTLAHSRLGKSRILSLAGNVYGAPPDLPAGVEWAALWSDFQPSNAVEAQFRASLAGKTPVETLRAGPLTIAVYRL